jgi:hypothetical protein
VAVPQKLVGAVVIWLLNIGAYTVTDVLVLEAQFPVWAILL